MDRNRIKWGSAALVALFLAIVVAFAAPCRAEAYQSVDRYVSNGHGYLNASYLVIHETANPGASAYNHTLLWSRDDTYAVHHVMELDGSTIYNTVAENRLCWHVGNGNYATIGIELAHATNAADFAKQWAEAVKWTGDELRAHGWDTSRLLSHYEAAQRWGDRITPIRTAIFASTAKRGMNSNRPLRRISVPDTLRLSHRPMPTATPISRPILPSVPSSPSPRARASISTMRSIIVMARGMTL